MESETLRDLLLREYKNTKLMYSGSVFGTRRETEIHTGNEWAGLSGFMTQEFSDAPIIEDPYFKDPEQNGFFLVGGDILYYNKRRLSEEIVFEKIVD